MHPVPVPPVLPETLPDEIRRFRGGDQSAAGSGWRSRTAEGTGSDACWNATSLPDVTRVYSAELANRSLPLVRRIVEDIVGQFARWQTRVREFEIVSASNSMSDPDPRAEELEREVALLAAELEHFHQELTALGVEFKDYALGLVDFPAEMDGRPMELCLAARRAGSGVLA